MNVVMRARDESGKLLEGPIHWPFDFAPVAGNGFQLSFGGHDGAGESDAWYGTIDRVIYDLSVAEGQVVIVIDQLLPVPAEPRDRG